MNKKKLNKVKKKKYKNNNILFLKNKILQHNNNIFKPDYIQHNNYNYSCNNLTNNMYKTWFKSYYYTCNKSSNNINIITEPTNEEELKNKDIRCCIPIALKPTNKQKEIINRWMKSVILMYNETVHFIKHAYKSKCNISYTFINIRKCMKQKRDNIIRTSHDTKKYRIRTHILDETIHLVCTNYKSAITNLKLGNISHFRMRYWKFNKSDNFLSLEAGMFNNIGYLCGDTIGLIEAYKDNKPFDLKLIQSNYKYTSKLCYSSVTNTYTLLLSDKLTHKDLVNEQQPKIKNYITLDPGIRTFMTGISNNEVIELGVNTQEKLMKYFNLINKIEKNKNNLFTKHEKKVLRRCRKRINGHVTELHWKTINYLTTRYNNILIGDMSIKGITNNNTSKLNKLQKKLGYALSFYKYRQRLQYKCNRKNINLYVVNERYTSKTCSNCGQLNNKLGGNKIFNCNKCNLLMDRDINACRNILMKTL